MKKKRDKAFYISRAKRDIRDLFIYFNITRPQYVPYYKVDGQFSKDRLLKELDFLTKWKHMSVEDKKYRAKTYVQYSRNFNITFSIPHELMAKVAGEYKDDSGKKHRLSYEQIVEDLIEEGFTKVLNSGRKFERTDEGQYKVKCWWCKKYIMANEKQWFKLMSEDKYKDINNYASHRLRKIVFKWASSFKKEKIECSDKTKENSHEEKVEVSSKNQTSNPTVKEVKEVMDSSMKKKISQQIITVCVEAGIISPETAVAWMGDLVYYRKQNPFTIDEAKMLYKTKSVQNKKEFKNRLLGCLLKMGISESEALYILVNNIKIESGV